MSKTLKQFNTPEIIVPKYLVLDKDGKLIKVKTLTKSGALTIKNKTKSIKLKEGDTNKIKIKEQGVLYNVKEKVKKTPKPKTPKPKTEKTQTEKTPKIKKSKSINLPELKIEKDINEYIKNFNKEEELAKFDKLYNQIKDKEKKKK